MFDKTKRSEKLFSFQNENKKKEGIFQRKTQPRREYIWKKKMEIARFKSKKFASRTRF